MRIYDEHERELTAPGEVGRIFVGNGLLFEGYTNGRSREVRDGLLATPADRTLERP